VHHIQRKILDLLMHAPALNYAQMRPKGVESNHFAYHLDQLVRAGLVVKNDRAYSLTTEGLGLVDRVSHADITVRSQPHIVTTICITNDAGQVALVQHEYQPYLHFIGFPQGRLHYGETVAEAANREVFEKTGLQDVVLTLRGNIFITATKDDTDVSRISSYVFTGTVTGKPKLVLTDPTKGKVLWADPVKYDKKSCMPGFRKIRKLLDTPGEFFFAETQAELE